MLAGKRAESAPSVQSVPRVEARPQDDANGAGKSDRQIAEHVGCSPTTVGTARAKLAATVQVGQSERTGRDGRTINTANIGKAKPAPQPEPEPIRASEWLDATDPVASRTHPERQDVAIGGFLLGWGCATGCVRYTLGIA